METMPFHLNPTSVIRPPVIWSCSYTLLLNPSRNNMNSLVFLAYTAFVTYASVRPMDSASLEPWDKVGHLVLYSIFALLGSRIVTNQRQFLYLCAGIIVYSGLMEIVQSFIPGRVGSAYDLLANSIGVIAGAAIAKWVFRAKNIWQAQA